MKMDFSAAKPLYFYFYGDSSPVFAPPSNLHSYTHTPSMNSKKYFIYNQRVPQKFWNWTPLLTRQKGLAKWLPLQTLSLKASKGISQPRLEADLGRIEGHKGKENGNLLPTEGRLAHRCKKKTKKNQNLVLDKND